jgi:hypothetical protein
MSPTDFLSLIYLRFEVFTAVTMKNTVFWDVAPCRYFVNWRFGGTVSPPSIRNPRAMNQREQVDADTASVYSHLLRVVHRSQISNILKMDAICSSETSVNKIYTRCHISEYDVLLNLFVCMLVVLWVIQSTQQRIDGWWIGHEVGGRGNIQTISWSEWRRPKKTTIIMVALPAEIRSRHLRNITEKHHRSVTLLQKYIWTGFDT